MSSSGGVQPLGFVPVEDGCLPAVVTYLEMLARPPVRATRSPRGGWALARNPDPSPDWYRGLYRDVGADWLWFSRLELTDELLAEIIRSPHVEVYEATCGAERAGMLELDRRHPGEVELAFFGLMHAYVGLGAGRWLMECALDLAWQRGVERVWVHTCTLDHPAALDFYVRSGFVPYRREIETVRDPRLRGILPLTAAPQQPLIGPPAE